MSLDCDREEAPPSLGQELSLALKAETSLGSTGGLEAGRLGSRELESYLTLVLVGSLELEISLYLVLMASLGALASL